MDLDIKKIPWLSIIGAVALLSIILFGSQAPNADQYFLQEWLPIYLTEGLFFIGFGLAMKNKTKVKGYKAELITSLMAFTWLMNQVVVWFNLLPKGMLSWVTAVINLVAFLELMGYELVGLVDLLQPMTSLLDIFDLTLDSYLLAFFAVAKIYLNVSYGTSLWAPITLWGVAVLLVAISSIATHWDYDNRETYRLLAPLGTLLAVYVAFSIQGPGLTLHI